MNPILIGYTYTSEHAHARQYQQAATSTKEQDLQQEVPQSPVSSNHLTVQLKRYEL